MVPVALRVVVTCLVVAMVVGVVWVTMGWGLHVLVRVRMQMVMALLLPR